LGSFSARTGFTCAPESSSAARETDPAATTLTTSAAAAVHFADPNLFCAFIVVV
jgi:hypothetical protein